MITTAGQVRAMLAGMPDNAPVFADVWTAKEIQQWIDPVAQNYAEDNGVELQPIDLTDASTLRRALNCIPDAWGSAGDEMHEELTNAIRDEFFDGDEE